MREEAVDPLERDRRRAVLRDIAERTRQNGKHEARRHPGRARQFMPFSALKGFEELVREQERRTEPRREMTEERARKLSFAIAALRKGDSVRAVHYADGAYRELEGRVESVDRTFRTLRAAGTLVSFDDIFALEKTASAPPAGAAGKP